MEWSALLNRVVLLNMYLGPEPEVPSFVWEQLITTDEEARIREAIQKARAGNGTLESVYGAYLLRTHLNIKKVSSSKVGLEALVEAMFCLQLGDRVKRLQLNRYSDVHEARNLIEGFVSSWRGGAVGSYTMGSIWWDGINPLRTPHAHWISTDLAEDKDFPIIFRRWLHDGNSLQGWLDGLEGSPALVNNAQPGCAPVFSTEAASGVMDLAKVMSPNTPKWQCLTSIPVSGGDPRPETKGALRWKACLVP